MSSSVRLIAFYLPQFHPIPENDYWWGKGFTEWRNVTGAKPVFPGHYQPHLPADLGFYDLRISQVREEQALMAREHGIYGFCYYYYYFNGKKLLQLPLEEMIQSGKPDFPFCICWANENWTRRWDGYESEILIKQQHSLNDDVNFIQQLFPAFKDKRYIRINGRLLMLVYRVDLLPDPLKTAEIWREQVREEMGEELYLCAVNGWVKEIDPVKIGFDATVQFPLDINTEISVDLSQFCRQHHVNYKHFKDYSIYDYRKAIAFITNYKKPYYKFFRGVFPSWDNTPRRQNAGKIFIHSNPELFKLFLKRTIDLTLSEQEGEERLIFINAWNEWAEGTHLEPDQKYGFEWLNAIKEALSEAGSFYLLIEDLKKKFPEDHDLHFTLDSLKALWGKDSRELIYSIDVAAKIQAIKSSLTWKVGHAITWLPAQLLSLYRSKKHSDDQK